MEKSITVEEKEEKKDSFFKKAINKVFNKDDGAFTAEKAWLKSTYGSNVSLTTEERILDKQKRIRETIKSKFRYPTSDTVKNTMNSSYRCVIDIEEDLEAYIDEILQPFIDGGFKVINLSEQIAEIEEENVYLISWKNIFKK
jgi:uncharacterized FlgJ-related protein